MPLTYTDRLVSLDNTTAPSLVDIAVGLSRQPRFGGQTRQWWSVLDHTLYCDDLVKDSATRHGVPTEGASDDEEALRRWRMAALLHDAHEALTGDVPSPLKTPDFKAMQEELDIRIMNAYFPRGYRGYLLYAEPVHIVDRRALLAEALLTLPHGTDRIARFFNTPDNDALSVLSFYLGEPYAAVPPLDREQERHPAVDEYLRRMMELL